MSLDYDGGALKRLLLEQRGQGASTDTPYAAVGQAGKLQGLVDRQWSSLEKARSPALTGCPFDLVD